MARTDRVSITISPLMMVALDHMCGRTGLSRSSQACMLMRQALARTMESKEVREKYQQSRAYRTASQWSQDEQTEHYVEQVWESNEASLAMEVLGNAAQEATGRTAADTLQAKG